MSSKYLDNKFIVLYMQKMDQAVDAYIAARNRGDWAAVKAATDDMAKMGRAIESRREKIAEGHGNSGQYPPNGFPGAGKARKQKATPAAVRAESEEA